MQEEFNHTIDTWLASIKEKNFEELCRQPAGNNEWSLGQICVHLINDTNWFMQQVRTCVSNNHNHEQCMSPFARIMFDKNSFPDEKLTNPANINMLQPESKEALLMAFENLKHEVKNAYKESGIKMFNGKTKHPGLGYFNADEWLQFAEMHMRHHLKQKERTETSLQQKH